MSEVDALKKMIIENMLKDLMNIQPAHIHIDLDKNGCTETSIGGRGVDIKFLAAVLNLQIIDKSGESVDEYFDIMKKFCKFEKNKDDNAQDKSFEKFCEMFKDLGIWEGDW